MKKTDFTKLSPKKQDESKTVKFTVKEKEGIVICQLKDRWYGRRFVGKTRVHDVDQWNEKKGRAIAFNKARRNELLFNIKDCEADMRYLDQMYQQEKHRIEKRIELNQIYLAGVNMELEELMETPRLHDNAEEQAGDNSNVGGVSAGIFTVYNNK